MKKSSLIIVIIVLLLIVIGLSFFVWLQMSGKNSAVKGDLTTTLLQGQESDWQDFNSPLGYTIKYPNNYFKVRNVDNNTDLFEHQVSEAENLYGGFIAIKRQPTDIKDLLRIYSIIEKNITKDDTDLITTKLINRKTTALEDGTEVIEYDQTGVEDTHNVILINGGYLFQLSYKTSNADALIEEYFNKMYPTIKFSQTGVDKASWDDHVSDRLGIKFKTPSGWASVENETGALSIVSPEDDILTISNQNKSLGISGSGKHFLIPFAGSAADIILAVGKDNVPVAGATGSGSSEGSLYFNLKFSSENPEIRNTNWQTMQEIIKTIIRQD